MKVTRSLSIAVVCAAVLFLVAGCGSDGDGVSADEHYLLGLDAMLAELENVDEDLPPWEWGVDLSDAFSHFNQALDQNYFHPGANFMAAICRLAMVLTDPALAGFFEETYADAGRGSSGGTPAIMWFLERPDAKALINAFAWRRNGDEFDPSLVGEAQDHIENTIIPALAYADERFHVFEQVDESFTITLDIPDMRAVVTVEIDAADAYVFHTELDVLQLITNAMVTYDLSIESLDICDAVAPGSDFLTLNSATYSANALGEIEDVADHISAICPALRSETDDQSDDLIVEHASQGGYLALDEALDSEDPCADFLEIEAHIREALTQGITLNPYDWDETAPYIEIVVDLDELFFDPLDDIKSYTPEYTCVDTEVVFEPPLLLPDPTMDGILPGMTQGAWDEIFDWLFGQR